jgi:exopolysaccharide biosynthesis polyprenyl glycosylphosphotransferase
MLRSLPTVRKLILLIGDIIGTGLSVYLAVLTVVAVYPVEIRTNLYYRMIPMNILLIGIIFGIYGLFSLAKKRYGEIFIGIFLSVFYTFVIMMAINFFIREFSYSRSILGVTAIYEGVLLNLWQNAMWRLENRLATPQKALIVGGGIECQRVLARLSISPQLNYSIAHVANDGAESGEWKEMLPLVDMVLLCSDVSLAKKAEIVGFCQQMQKDVLLMPSVYELYCSGLTVDKIDDIPFFRPQYLNPSLERRSLKRIFDIVFSLFVLVVCSIPMLIISLAVKLDSKGPVLYRQIRTGRYEREFFVFKFRSMRQDAEVATGPVMAGEDDPRITRVGRFLRRTRLDELPQFFNVLQGSMSVVGPRPERPFFVKQFKKEIPEYTYRHNVKPGITGMAQIYGKYNTIAYDKLIYDLMYVQKCDFFTDLVIIIQTVRVLFQKSSTEGVVQEKDNNT